MKFTLNFLKLTPEKIELWKRKKKVHKLNQVLLTEKRLQLLICTVNALHTVGNATSIEPLFFVLETYFNPNLVKITRQTILAIKDPHCHEPLILMLQKNTLQLRQLAIEALHQNTHPKAVKALINQLNDPEKQIRVCAAKGLAQLPEIPVKTLLDTYQSQDIEVDQILSPLLLKQKQALLPLLQAYLSTIKRIDRQLLLIPLLPHFPYETVAPIFEKKLFSENPLIFESCLTALLTHPNPQSATLLLRFFDEKIFWKQYLTVQPIRVVSKTDECVEINHEDPQKQQTADWDHTAADRIIRYLESLNSNSKKAIQQLIQKKKTPNTHPPKSPFSIL